MQERRHHPGTAFRPVSASRGSSSLDVDQQAAQTSVRYVDATRGRYVLHSGLCRLRWPGSRGRGKRRSVMRRMVTAAVSLTAIGAATVLAPAEAVDGTTRTVSASDPSGDVDSRLDIVFESFRGNGDGTATLDIRTAEGGAATTSKTSARTRRPRLTRDCSGTSTRAPTGPSTATASSRVTRASSASSCAEAATGTESSPPPVQPLAVRGSPSRSRSCGPTT